MVTVNSISGGKTSAYMALRIPADVNIYACVCIDYPPAAPKDPAVLQYCLHKLNGNFIASAESKKTLKVIMDLEQALGQEIVWVRGKSFDQIIDEAGCLPTWARRFCTTKLKIEPIFEYVYPRYGEVRMNIGFRADELDRIKKATENGSQLEYFHPVSCNLYGQNRQNWAVVRYGEKAFPLKRTFHYQVKNFLSDHFPGLIFPFDSNCKGCHHKSNELIKHNYQEEPEVLEWFALQEKKGKANTWHDDQIPYEEIFKTDYYTLFPYAEHTMCNSGYCHD